MTTARPPPPLVTMLCAPDDPRDVQTRLDDEVRRLAHAEWLRTGNPDEYHNWNEGEKAFGARLIHTGTVHWLYKELAAREKQLSETGAQARQLEARCADLRDPDGVGTALSNAEAKLQSREALLRGEIAAEQAKLATCEAKIHELEPALEKQNATLATRNRHIAECDSYVQSLKATLENTEHEASAKAMAEERCKDLENTLEAKQAELARRNEQLKLQDARIGDMEAWLGSKQEDLTRGLAQLAAQGQALREREEHLYGADPSSLTSRIMELEAALAAGRAQLEKRDRELAEGAERLSSLEASQEASGAACAGQRQGPERPIAQEVEDTVRRLQSELAERDRKLSAERARVGKLEAIEEDLHRELSASEAPRASKPWEGQGPDGPKRLEASLHSSREELSLQHEELLARDKRIAQQEAQTQALGSLLRARRAELDARGSQLQALQSQLAVRDQRIREQDRRARHLETQREELRGQLQAHRSELATSHAELREYDLELSVQSNALLLQEERAAATCEVQCERIAELEAHVRQRDGELVDQFATERALVAHSARLREVEESLVEACDRKVAQQEAQVQALSSLLKARSAELEAKGAHLEAQNAQLQAHVRRAEEQEVQAGRLEEARAALYSELEAESWRRAEADERLRESDACAEELGASLQVHREELAASEVGIQARDEELAALRASREEQVEEFEERLRALQPEQPRAEEELRAQHEEILALEARLRTQHTEQQEELATEKGARAGSGGLSKLEERLAQCLAKVRKAAEDAAEARQAAAGKRRSSKQGVARSFLTVRGIDFALLSAHSEVLERFKNVLRETVSSESGPGVSPEDVALELWGGSVVACCTIAQPQGVSATSIEARLRSSTTLCRAVADGVAQVEGIDQVSVGPLSVIVHNVRPEARASASTVSPSVVDHRGNPTPPPERQASAGLQEPAAVGRIAGFLAALTPRRRNRFGSGDLTGEKLGEKLGEKVGEKVGEKLEDGTVRKRVQEIEGKVPAAGSETPRASEEGATPAGAITPREGDGLVRKVSRPNFRSRAYSPRHLR